MSTRRQLRVVSVALLLAVSGCIDGLVIDEQRNEISLPDASGLEEDEAAVSRPDADADADAGADAQPEPARDASAPLPPPSMDAGSVPQPVVDAGRDAGRDAGSPLPPQDAGAMKPDAGCSGEACDAGTPPGPCHGCAAQVLIAGETCDNGAPKLCWFDPDGECSVQCPSTPSCTKDAPDACGPGRYCYFPKNDCGKSTAGFCATIPSECADVNVPSCGCDGVIYKNPCVAAIRGATATYLGDMATCRVVDR